MGVIGFDAQEDARFWPKPQKNTSSIAGRTLLLAAATGRTYLSHHATTEEKTGMADQMNRVLGDSPGRTIIKLIVVSLIVGFVMAVFDVRPWDVFYGIRDFVVDLWHRGFSALGAVGDYLILGATIVIPAFIILRLLSYRR
jgi:hypothetical protein